MTDPAERRNEKGQPGITRAALFGLCPRCGEQTLWDGPARFADACGACGQDFAGRELSGRVLFVPVALAAMAVGWLAITLDDRLHLPLAALLVLAMPLTVVVVLAVLRFAKAAMLVARLDGGPQGKKD